MLCECGCGQRTLLKPVGQERERRGEPMRFIHGHQSGTPRNVRQAPWATMIVEFLLKEKRGGEKSFDAAWRRAIKAFPPRGRDMGEAVPTLFALEGLDDTKPELDVSIVEFTEFACGQAWMNYVGSEPGQGKALARFHPALLEGMSDSSEPAARLRTAA